MSDIEFHIIDHFTCRLIEREGGYVNHPADRGGPTNMGITLKTLRRWRKQRGYPFEVTADDIKNLSMGEAISIYRQFYWFDPGFDDLNLSVPMVEMVFDTGVHSGTKVAKRLLQAAAGTKVDGVIGPKSVAAIDAMEPVKLASAFMAFRVAYIGRLITKRPSQAAFAWGWMNRMKELMFLIPQAC
jgi:lysozyme family protein